MNLNLAKLGGSITLVAASEGLSVQCSSTIDWNDPSSWPEDALGQSAGRRTAYEVASMAEMGLGTIADAGFLVPYSNFEEADKEEFRLTTSFAPPSPFLLKIDRVSDIGRPDFRYRYEFLLGTTRVPLERAGYFVRRSSTAETFRLDGSMYSLLEAMDSFNALPSTEKKPQRAWLDFAHVKAWATEAQCDILF